MIFEKRSLFVATATLLVAGNALAQGFPSRFTDLPAAVPTVAQEELKSVEEQDEYVAPMQLFDPTSPTEILKGYAETAIKNGQHKAAIDALSVLHKRGETEFADYGRAVALAQMGLYDKSIQQLQTLMGSNAAYKTQAEELESKLLLTLAETAQKQGRMDDAEPFLRTYYKKYAQGKQSRRFVRLAKAQGWPREGAEKERTYPYLRVGVLLPLSGKFEAVGQDLLQAMQMAVFETENRHVLLYPEDTLGTPEGAEEAAERLLRLGVDVVLGPLLSGNVDAASPYTRQSNVPLVSFSSNAGVAGRKTFVMGLLPEQQTEYIAQHAVANSRTTVAALVPQNTFGLEAFKAFEQQITQQGATLLPPVYYNPKDADISKALAKLLKLEESKKVIEEERKTLEAEFLLVGGAMDDADLARLKELRKMEVEPIIEFDALFLPTSAQAMPLIAAQLAFYDVTPRNVMFLGTAQWENAAVLSGGADYVQGSRFAGTPVAGKEKFKALFEKTYGRAPRDVAILAYDAVLLINQLMQEDVREFRHAMDELDREEGFYGLTGPYRFTKRGLSERRYDILEVRRRGFKTIEAAPVMLPPALPRNLDPKRGSNTGGGGFFDFWN